MSWVGYLLKHSELFISFAENSQILFKIYVIPILFNFPLSGSTLSVSKQPTQLIVWLNSSLRHIIVTKALPRPNLSSGLKDLAVPELKAKMLFNTSRQSFILNQKNKKSLTKMGRYLGFNYFQKLKKILFSAISVLTLIGIKQGTFHSLVLYGIRFCQLNFSLWCFLI